MFRRLVTAWVCLALIGAPLRVAHAGALPEAVDAAALRALHPQAQIIEVAPEDYPALEQQLRAAGYRPQAQASAWQVAAAEAAQEEEAPASPPPQLGSDCEQASARSGGGGGGVNVNIGGHGGGSGREAAVVFVIIGTVVLVMWTLYAVKYLVDRARGVDFCGRRWNEWSLSTSSITSYGLQYGHFAGLRYVGGVSPGSVGFGIGAELGHADVLLTDWNTAGVLQLRGLYWLLGPVLRWRLSDSANPSYFQMEFQAGSTANPEMGLIAAARLGVNFGLSERLRLGLSYGAMNMKLHEQGIILDRSRYYMLWGLDVGWRF